MIETAVVSFRRITTSYIGVRIDKNGKIDFFEADRPLLYDDFSNELKKIIEPQAPTVKLPPAIEDEESRKKLKKAKEILDTLSFAITTVLER